MHSIENRDDYRNAIDTLCEHMNLVGYPISHWQAEQSVKMLIAGQCIPEELFIRKKRSCFRFKSSKGFG